MIQRLAGTARFHLCLNKCPEITPWKAVHNRLISSLAILEQRDGVLNPISLRAITAAQKLEGPITGFIAGGNILNVAKKATKIQGLEKVIAVNNMVYEKVCSLSRLLLETTEKIQGLPEIFAPLVIENIKKGGYTHIFAGHTTFAKGLMPRIAAMLDVSQVSDIIDIVNESTFIRPIYAGNALSTVESLDKLRIVTVRGTAFEAAAHKGGSALLEDGLDPNPKSLTEWVSENLSKTDRPSLASAERVVSGGRGLKSKEEFDKIIIPLADALGAAIGASRAAVDSGYADNSLQVGQTGQVVAPELYFCTGISGAIQHLAGMKDSKVIAAINKDKDAPIFQVADVGLVGDLFEKVPELTNRLLNKV